MLNTQEVTRIMGERLSLLYLSEQDTNAAGVQEMSGCIATMEEVMRLLAAGDYVMGGPNRNSHGLKLNFYPHSELPGMPLAGPDRRFMALAAYLGGEFHVCGTKWYGSNIANRAKGLPRSIHTLILNDPETGAPQCIMTGNLVSSMRTGAMAGVGAKHLARKGASVLAQIGVGVIGRACCEAILMSCPSIKELRTVSFTRETAVTAAKDFSSRFGIQAQACPDLEEAVRGADIVCFANSGPVKPVLRHEWLAPGSIVVASADFVMAAADMRACAIAVDNWKMYEAYEHDFHALDPKEAASSGALIGTLIKEVRDGGIRQEGIIPLGQAVANGKVTHRDERPVLLFLDGMCVEDVAWGYRVFQNAKDKGLGTELPLF